MILSVTIFLTMSTIEVTSTPLPHPQPRSRSLRIPLLKLKTKQRIQKQYECHHLVRKLKQGDLLALLS